MPRPPVQPFTALVLAGRRNQTDPVAQEAGHSHKVLVPIAGIPMLVHVLRVLRATPSVCRIVVSTDDATAFDSLPDVQTLTDAGVLSFHSSKGSPSASVLDYFQGLSQGEPLLVTTADHPLLTTEMVSYFCNATVQSRADIIIGVVAASLFRACYPHSKRSFIPLRGESFCGTNLFALRTPRAAAAAKFWEHAGHFRKRPWRLISTFGVKNTLLLALKRLDLDAAIPRVSQVLGARIGVVQMPFSECAIDVDNLDDLATVTRILTKREEVKI